MSEITKETIDEIIKRIDENVSEAKWELREVKLQTIKTNGNVKDLQLWRARANGAITVISIVMTTILLPLILYFLKLKLFS
ncbi:hypothetical protein M0R04_10680 [Candidatus Dojkabacteria bacterium]|jgi:hypothetical protein|nr:hypothetical protein [Candidatus Dojkabacteria bacterium]